MVAVRSSHLLNPKNFNILQWCANLALSSQNEQDLVCAWQYLNQKTQSLTNSHCFLNDSVEMVEILHSLNMDSDTLLAAMLFPIVDANIVTLEDIKQDFNIKIAKLIKGVMEMNNIRQLNTNQSNNIQIDNIRRMLLAMVDDFRCVIIKLAERITYLRDANKRYSQTEKNAVAQECNNIYSPLANRLGIGQLKWELEDYCFRNLQPQQYRFLAHKLAERRFAREQYIQHFVQQLTDDLQQSIEQVEIYGRPKHIYSIWRKMQQKNLKFEQLYDIRAVRIIVKQLQDCYTALGIVHTRFKHIASEFDDYIANPKPNGYQSIHTIVLGEGEKPIEVQIRTEQMHNDAELGVAAHWKYKEGTTGSISAYEEKISWLRKLLAWQADIADSSEIHSAMRSQIFDDRVYVFTPKGEVVNLPVGATPLDFAYAIHSDVGHRCIGAKVAGRIVPFTYQLQMGDQLEIITQKNPNPSRDWLNPNAGFTHTSKARSKIIAWFKKQDRDKNIPAGKELLDNELQRLNLTIKQVEQYALAHYNLKNVDDLYNGIGSGDIKLHQLINFLQNKLIKPNAEQIDQQILRQVAHKNAVNTQQKTEQQGYVIVKGVNNLMHHIARCCLPIPGDQIAGYITRGRGISIHRADCEQFHDLRQANPERVIETSWSEQLLGKFHLNIRLIATDRNGLLRDITTALSNEKINVSGISSRLDHKRQLATIHLELELNHIEMLSRIFARLTQLDGIIDVKRI